MEEEEAEVVNVVLQRNPCHVYLWLEMVKKEKRKRKKKNKYRYEGNNR